MKLEDVIRQLDTFDESLTIFQKGSLNINSDIELFSETETSGAVRLVKEGIEYHYLLEIFIAKEFIEGWIDHLGKTPSAEDLAIRVFQYAIYDA